MPDFTIMARPYSRTISTLLALGLSSLFAAWPVSVRAEEKTEEGQGFKFPGLIDRDSVGYYQLPQINVPVIRDNKISRIVSVSLVIETKGEANKSKVMAHRLDLQDAFLRELYGVAAFVRSDGQTFDPAVLKARLRGVSDKILGPGVVENIFVAHIADRGLSS